MSIQVTPGSTFEAYSPETTSGLVAMIGVRIRDGAGTDFLARTTASITEDVNVGATSVYRRSFTAPTTAGQYWIVWDTGTVLLDATELVVTSSATTTTLVGTNYITAAEMKATLSISGQTFADDDITAAISAASRAIDRTTGRRYFTVVETRYYTPDPRDMVLDIDDLETTGSTAVVAVDVGGSGSFSTWTANTHFTYEPINAPLDSEPYTQIVLRSQGGASWPLYRNTVRISNGSFGWPAVPPEITEATGLLANRLLKRSREAQLGIVTAGIESGVAMHIARRDPDVYNLLRPFDRTRPLA